MRQGAAVTAEAFSALPGTPRVERLDNGLTVCLLENRQAPIVTSALFYRAGTRDEPAGHGGVAHFLEHMMFKGSPRYGPGEIDRRTQALGGVNNAFTSHDATGYYFNFAADRWTEALAIEADRMAGLTLDPEQVASERQVILEEIAMYESEPWEALETEVQARLFAVPSLRPPGAGHPGGAARHRTGRPRRFPRPASTGRTTPSWSWPATSAPARWTRWSGPSARKSPVVRAGTARRYLCPFPPWSV